jgi:hypothetical protein
VRLFGGGDAGSAPGSRQGSIPDSTPGSSPGSTPGFASGELYLSIAEGKWYVADAQVGLAALGTARPPRREKYVPSEAR